MRALGYLLDLHNLDYDLPLEVPRFPMDLNRVKLMRLRPSFWRWLSHYGYRRDPRFRGFKWMKGEAEQQEIMRQLHAQIIPERGVRVRCEDIPDFPKCDIQAELYDIDDPARVNQLYAEIIEALGLIRTVAESDVAPDSPLTRMIRGRQEIELLKLPIAEELGNDYRAKGFSVVFFVNFTETIHQLKGLFPGALVIDGHNVETRDRVLEEFQSNQCRELIVNNSAGGEAMSLQDLDGGYPRVGLLMPCHSATMMRQLFGRLPRDGGKSTAHYRVLFANDTYERQMHRALRAKLNNLDALTDADCNPANLILS